MLTLGPARGHVAHETLAYRQSLFAPPIQPAPAAEAPPYRVRLPLIFAPQRIAGDAAIWSHSATPGGHETALFRRSFTLTETLSAAEMHIFADTRYEVWLDGEWLGRGPARFSQTYREFDVYNLGELSPGAHTLAALVHWAANIRRSESMRPYLQAHIQGAAGDLAVIPVRTGTDWRVYPGAGWNLQAAPVHAWGLIGPTELLDLRAHPHGWMETSFSDAAWKAAQAVEAGYAGQYTPRSIPFLDSAPITPTLISSGTLAAGYALVELVPPLLAVASLPFTADGAQPLRLQALGGADGPEYTFALDGKPFAWLPAGSDRPDVYLASRSLSAGAHTLTVSGYASDGATFAHSTAGMIWPARSLEQGVHAGRRLLLAEPLETPGAVSALPGEGVNLRFSTLPSYAVLDLGRTVHGRVAVTLDGPAGAVVDIGWDERLLPGTQRPLPYPGSRHPEWNQVDSWVLDGVPRSVTTLDARAGRYLLIAVWGGAPVQLSGLRVYEERLPLALQGDFQSSDEQLNRIWRAGVETLYPNMTDSYTDTPWRERGGWWGDAYVEEHANRVSFGDTSLYRRGLLLMQDAFQRTPAPGIAPHSEAFAMLDYAMLWVQGLDEYAQTSEDLAFVRRAYPQVEQFMAHLAGYQNASTGLLDIPPAHWSQSAYLDPLGQSSRYGQSTALNAMYSGTLLSAARLAQYAGQPARAQAWQAQAEALRLAIHEHLYNYNERRYAATLYQGQAEPPSPHAQAWALAYDIPPQDERAVVAYSLLDLLSDDPAAPNVEIYGFYWVLEGLGRAGRVSEALDLLETYYGAMLDQGSVTWWESFNSLQDYRGSLSHGWGAAPTWFLTTYLMGARQTGAQTWQLAPPLSGVSQVSGALPLRGAALQAAWRVDACGGAQITLDAPPGYRGSLRLPAAWAGGLVALDGVPAWDGRALLLPGVRLADGGVSLSIPPGEHIVLINAGNCAP